MCLFLLFNMFGLLKGNLLFVLLLLLLLLLLSFYCFLLIYLYIFGNKNGHINNLFLTLVLFSFGEVMVGLFYSLFYGCKPSIISYIKCAAASKGKVINKFVFFFFVVFLCILKRPRKCVKKFKYDKEWEA